MFEFDPVKSALNAEKHGIDFIEAQALWSDDKHIVTEARLDDEPRFAATGRIGDLMWTAIGTLRGSKIRLISVRRARRDEVNLYESQNEDDHS
jgi:uncharacterized protein